MTKNFDVFISHSSVDVELADALVLYLEDRDIKCWIAPRNINNDAGLDYGKSIIEGIDSSSIMVIIFSKNSSDSVYVRIEAERALHYRLPIIPFNIDKTERKEFEFYLSIFHWIEVSDGIPQNHFKDLYKSCVKRLGKIIEPDNLPLDIIPIIAETPDNKIVVVEEIQLQASHTIEDKHDIPDLTKQKLLDNEAAMAPFKTHWPVLFFFIFILVGPALFCGIITVTAPGNMESGIKWHYKLFIELFFLLCTITACYGIIKLITRGLKFREAKKHFQIGFNIDLTRELSPFLMTNSFRSVAILNFFLLVYAIVSFSIKASRSDPKEYAIWLTAIISLALYISIVSLILSQKKWLVRYWYLSVVLTIIYFIVV